MHYLKNVDSLFLEETITLGLIFLININGIPSVRPVAIAELLKFFHSHCDLEDFEIIQVFACVFLLSGQSTTRRGKEHQRPARSGGLSPLGSGKFQIQKYDPRTELKKVNTFFLFLFYLRCMWNSFPWIKSLDKEQLLYVKITQLMYSRLNIGLPPSNFNCPYHLVSRVPQKEKFCLPSLSLFISLLYLSCL